MPLTLENFFIAIGLSFLIVFTVSLLFAIVQIKRTCRQAEIFFEDINQGLRPLLRSLTETSAELQKLTQNLNKRLEKVDEIVMLLQQAGETVASISNLAKKKVMPIFTQINAVEAGVKAFTHFLFKNRR